MAPALGALLEVNYEVVASVEPAVPFADFLKSRKIMRRILRKVAANEIDHLGDTSMLAEPAVVDDIIENRLSRRRDLPPSTGPGTRGREENEPAPACGACVRKRA